MIVVSMLTSSSMAVNVILSSCKLHFGC